MTREKKSPDAICRAGRNRWEKVSRPPRRDFWHRVTPSPFRRQVQVAASGTPLHPGGLPASQWTFWARRRSRLDYLIGIISSGLVCYLLARYLTSPVVRLRAATQRLAAGDLSARAGGLSARRRDEMAQLVRDFDTMAERLEATVNAQSPAAERHFPRVAVPAGPSQRRLRPGSPACRRGSPQRA